VTGAYGFTGGHLVRRLADLGWSLRGLCRPASRATVSSRPQVEPHLGDLETGEGLDDAPRGVEVVFHAASVVATSSREQAQAVIVEGTRRLAQASARHGVRRFVQISTTAVYGHGPLMDADEETPLRPEDPYGEAKARVEEFLLEMNDRGDLEVVLLRPRLIYGPGDQHFLPTVREALRRRQVILINGGRAVNDFVWVEDLVEACRLAAATPEAAGRAHNITGGESVTSREFFCAVADRFGLPRPRLSLPYPAAWPIAAALTAAQSLRGHTTSYSPLKRLRLFGLPHHFSIERARRVLGYEPAVAFRQGLTSLGPQDSASAP
jgi:nucleoside-diphosphate-sugar epimerase